MSDAPPDSSPAQLAPRLEEVLRSLPDADFAHRLREVYEGAARTIHRLGDMDLLRYETTTVEGAPDLSLWEEMAPVIRDTVVDVNALLSTARRNFPPAPAEGALDPMYAVIEGGGSAPPQSAMQRRQSEAASVIQSFTQEMAAQISSLGERMRSPQVVADRWNLLADLQAFRSRFRELIGDLVYESINAFAHVTRAEVVPFWREELEAAVAVRAALADLSRLMVVRGREAETCEPEDVLWHAQRLARDLDAFGRTPAYRSLRAQDKRVLIEFRHALTQLCSRPGLPRADLLDRVGPFAEFASSLLRVNQREILLVHDREVQAAVGVQLEQAEALWQQHPEAARGSFLAAVRRAQALYGRDGALDVFLRKDRKGTLATLDLPALRPEMDALRELLAGIPMA